MRLLLNENMPASALRQLRDRGHDVLSAKESLRGESDEVVLDRAQRELRIVVTQDKDFGVLAFRQRLPAECGIILFRLTGDDPNQDAHRIVEVIESRADWSGEFAVATDALVRVRAIPPSPSP
jgi:predicted nuclease of predicted toxin-antitoxin system